MHDNQPAVTAWSPMALPHKGPAQRLLGLTSRPWSIDRCQVGPGGGEASARCGVDSNGTNGDGAIACAC
jgi:hypothetical protein